MMISILNTKNGVFVSSNIPENYLQLRSPKRNVVQTLTDSTISITLSQNRFVLTIPHQSYSFISDPFWIISCIIGTTKYNIYDVLCDIVKKWKI